ncbi:UNVERIFIED_CONTAM: hypothetical protein GTU68_002013 [Idotea baltica]|nr:hypothetical protein [Idotea baltica]
MGNSWRICFKRRIFRRSGRTGT